MACGCGAHLSCSGAFVPGAAGTGLWNVDFGCLVRSLVCLVQPFWGSGTVVWVEVGLSTLLGFEGSVAVCGGFSVRTWLDHSLLGGLAWARPYFENFTVDASIFVD